MCNTSTPSQPAMLATVELTATLHDWTAWREYSRPSTYPNYAPRREWRARKLEAGPLLLASIIETREHPCCCSHFHVSFAGQPYGGKPTKYYTYEEALASLKAMLP